MAIALIRVRRTVERLTMPIIWFGLAGVWTLLALLMLLVGPEVMLVTEAALAVTSFIIGVLVSLRS